MKPIAIALAATGLLALVPVGGFAQSTQLQIRHKTPFGNYLTDANGRALYLFTADHAGASACSGACAKAWPPFTTSSTTSVGQGVSVSKLGRIARGDGAQQVTYENHPLYYFVGDRGAGSTAGQDIDHFGGEWYLVSPQGRKVEANAKQASGW